jgi:hypothetical protein
MCRKSAHRSVAFVATAWPFLVGMGIEVDEALAGSGLYPNTGVLYGWTICGRILPAMLLSYLGATKVWMCAPLFALWGPSQLTLRIPSLLLGAATLAVFWSVLRSVSTRAAYFGTLMLATDTAFLLLTTIDFGPVALQLFLKTAIMWLFVRWKLYGRSRYFAAAFFLGGLAMWDKALFAWNALGLMLGAAVAFPVHVLRFISPARVLVAAGALCAGAVPLLLFNVEHPWETLRSNARLRPAEVPAKLPFLFDTLNGSVLQGLYTASDVPPQPGHSLGLANRLIRAARTSGALPEANWTVWAYMAALLGMPLLWRTRVRDPAVFGAVSFFVTWVVMAGTAGAGAAAHHVVLLWPSHFIVIAVVMDEFAKRVRPIVIAALAATLVSVNIGVTASYYEELVRNGPGIRWTRASQELSAHLVHTGYQRVFVVDWGIYETLALLSEGRLPLLFANEYTSAGTVPERRKILSDIMDEPGTVFVTHASPYEQVIGANAALDAFARESGLKKVAVTRIKDSFGREVFWIIQFGT